MRCFESHGTEEFVARKMAMESVKSVKNGSGINFHLIFLKMEASCPFDMQLTSLVLLSSLSGRAPASFLLGSSVESRDDVQFGWAAGFFYVEFEP